MEASQLNRRNSRGETILFKSIERNRPYTFIISLIESGCDVNISTNRGNSPLHMAMYRRTSKVANELIKAGANINALDINGETPLHYVTYLDVEVQTHDMVDVLLYYGADISIRSDDNRTPLMKNCNVGVFQRLIRYYDEYSCISITQQNEERIAEYLESVDLNCIWTPCKDTFFLRLSMYCGFSELFQLIWKRLEHGKLLVGKEPFLVTYCRDSELSSFTTSNWLDRLNLILISPCAVRFVAHCNNYQHLYLPKLIQAFVKHGVNKKDRLAILYWLFSLGAEVCCFDIDCIRRHYGFNEEFEACIYAGNYRGRISDVDCDSPLLTFIFGLEEENSAEKVLQLFKHRSPNHYYRFFSLSHDMKRELEEAWDKSFRSEKILDRFGEASMFYTADVAKKLPQMSEFPSLLELSRNAAQGCIRKNYAGKTLKPYQFHDVVKSLGLPKNLQEVLTFTRPIYPQKL